MLYSYVSFVTNLQLLLTQDMANILDTVHVKFTPSEGASQFFYALFMVLMLVVKCLAKQLFEGLQYV